MHWIVPPSSRPYNVTLVKSTDGGATWSPPAVIARESTVFVTDPNTGDQVRTGDIIPEPAIDPGTGRLYVVWQDSRFNGGHYDEVALSTSSDGGETWSDPIRVNTATGRPAFTPSVRVGSDGTVGVTYYDFRNLTSETSTLPTDYWFTSSTEDVQTVGAEQHLAGPFDMLSAPCSDGYFTGDYEALDAADTGFVALFVAANSGDATNPTDVFAAAVTP